MAEFQFNPETGQGEEIQGGLQAQLSQEDTFLDKTDHSHQLEAEQALINKTAEGLSERGGVSFDPTESSDFKLMQIQQQLFAAEKSGDWITAQRCVDVLDGLATGQLQQPQTKATAPAPEQKAPAPKAPQLTQEQVDEGFNSAPAIEQLRNELSAEKAEQVLEAMRSDMTAKEEAEFVSQVMTGDEAATATLQVYKSIANNEDWSAPAGTEVPEWTDTNHSQLAEAVGDEMAQQMEVISAAVHNGVTSRAEAFKTVAQSPALAAAFATALSNGLIQLY